VLKDNAFKDKEPARRKFHKICNICACTGLDVVFLKRSVKFWNSAKRQHRPGKFAAVILMLSLWLGTLALTLSPELHELLHKDAKSSAHNCVVTQISAGSLLAGSAPVTAPVPPVSGIGLSVAVEAQNFFSFDYRLSPSRAPPSASKLYRA